MYPSSIILFQLKCITLHSQSILTVHAKLLSCFQVFCKTKLCSQTFFFSFSSPTFREKNISTSEETFSREPPSCPSVCGTQVFSIWRLIAPSLLSVGVSLSSRGTTEFRAQLFIPVERFSNFCLAAVVVCRAGDSRRRRRRRLLLLTLLTCQMKDCALLRSWHRLLHAINGVFVSKKLTVFHVSLMCSTNWHVYV